MTKQELLDKLNEMLPEEEADQFNQNGWRKTTSKEIHIIHTLFENILDYIYGKDTDDDSQFVLRLYDIQDYEELGGSVIHKDYNIVKKIDICNSIIQSVSSKQAGYLRQFRRETDESN